PPRSRFWLGDGDRVVVAAAGFGEVGTGSRRLVAVSQVKIHVTVGATAEPAAAFRVAAADGDGQRRSVRRHLDGFVLPLLRVDVRIVPVLAHVGTGLDHAHRAAFV